MENTLKSFCHRNTLKGTEEREILGYGLYKIGEDRRCRSFIELEIDFKYYQLKDLFASTTAPVLFYYSTSTCITENMERQGEIEKYLGERLSGVN